MTYWEMINIKDKADKLKKHISDEHHKTRKMIYLTLLNTTMYINLCKIDSIENHTLYLIGWGVYAVTFFIMAGLCYCKDDGNDKQ